MQVSEVQQPQTSRADPKRHGKRVRWVFGKGENARKTFGVGVEAVRGEDLQHEITLTSNTTRRGKGSGG